jgi:hypothetical protein
MNWRIGLGERLIGGKKFFSQKSRGLYLDYCTRSKNIIDIEMKKLERRSGTHFPGT